MTTALTESAVRSALSRVEDPEIGKPITELNMVNTIEVDGQDVSVEILLTIAGCPMKNTIDTNVRAAIEDIEGVGKVNVTLGAMTDEQRLELKKQLRGSCRIGDSFREAGSTTRVFAVASGKGGVGKSTMTVNLAAALHAQGYKVGVVDADIYGHSVPGQLGSTAALFWMMRCCCRRFRTASSTFPSASFVQGNAPIVWRGPMLHRALQQFLTDVFWGDLDFLLLDLPPGTGDVALSVAQLIPTAELLVVTTPQAAAAEVAERAGSISQQTHQRVAGVIENMSAMVLPDGTLVDVFGSGGGQVVAERLTTLLGYDVEQLGQVPLEPALRVDGDAGTPTVIANPESAASQAISEVASKIAKRRTSLAGKPLGLGVTNR